MLEEASQRDKEKEEKLGVVMDKVNKVDMTPWMRRTGWIQRFSNRNMNTLSAYSQKAQDSEEQLKIIEKSCIRIINHCSMGTGLVTAKILSEKSIASWLSVVIYGFN